jgi:HK97 family phage portal protein
VFPAIAQAWRDLKAGFGDAPLSIKTGGQSFDAVNVEWYARNGFNGIYSALSGGAPAWSGEHVGESAAQNHSVVWACKRIISESTAFLPLSLMQETTKGKFPAKGHPTYQAVHNSPNVEMTSMGWRETVTGHMVLGGNGYSRIVRRSGTNVAREFYPIHPSQIRTDRNKSGRLVYLVKDGNSQEVSYTVESGKPQDILHIRGLGDDGVNGYSVLTMARQSIGTALGAEKFAGKFWANGGRVPYNLKLSQKFKTEQDYDKFRADWEAIYSQPHKAPILEPNIEYQQTGMSLADMQMLGSRQYGIPEICRWFLISPHLVGDLSRATFSNIEQLALEFVKMTLTAWITRWEQELWRCVLTDKEKSDGYFFKHNLNGLLRGDFVSRTAGYASALQNGYFSQDDVRELEDRNPLPNGEGQHYHIQLNMRDLGVDPATAYLAGQSATAKGPQIVKGAA